MIECDRANAVAISSRPAGPVAPRRASFILMIVGAPGDFLYIKVTRDDSGEFGSRLYRVGQYIGEIWFFSCRSEIIESRDCRRRGDAKDETRWKVNLR